MEISSLLPKIRASLNEIIRISADLIINCVEPDFCLGGELYARGTWNFFSHGLLKYAVKNNLTILPILLKVLESRFNQLPVNIQDDYILQHHLWSDLITLNILKKIQKKNLFDSSFLYRKNIELKSKEKVHINKFFKDSGHLFITHGNYKTHVSILMGGLFRTYNKKNIITQDTQNLLNINNTFYAANSLNKNISWKWLDTDKLLIKGKLCKYKMEKMTTLKLILLRLIMFLMGKYFPNLIRKIMQKILINPKLENERIFERELVFEPNKLKVSDRYFLKEKDLSDVTIQNTSFNNFKHVVMSRIFHPYYLRITSPKYSKLSKFKNYLSLFREW